MKKKGEKLSQQYLWADEIAWIQTWTEEEGLLLKTNKGQLSISIALWNTKEASFGWYSTILRESHINGLPLVISEMMCVFSSKMTCWTNPQILGVPSWWWKSTGSKWWWQRIDVSIKVVWFRVEKSDETPQRTKFSSQGKMGEKWKEISLHAIYCWVWKTCATGTCYSWYMCGLFKVM